MSPGTGSESLLGRIRQPAYTGDNRCVPCTAVNLVIALAGAGLLALVAVELGAAFFGVALALIYLRGYLVPGTPWLTRRFFPDEVLALFGKERTREAVVGLSAEKIEAFREGRIDPEALLIENDVLQCRDGGLAFTPAFEAQLHTQLDTARAEAADPADRDHEVIFGRETLATLCDSEPDDIEYKPREMPAFAVGYRIRKWPSRAALLADVAADRALRAGDGAWADLPLEQRLKLLDALRLFHDSCPACGGSFDRIEKDSSACCMSGDGNIIAYRCRDCQQVLFERSENTNDWMPFEAARD